jgi:hypothetical protein
LLYDDAWRRLCHGTSAANHAFSSGGLAMRDGFSKLLRRSLAVRTALLIGLSALATAGCGGGGGPARVTTGTPDKPQTDALRIDKSGMSAVVAGGRLQLSIPVTNIGATDGTASLGLSIIQVDGQKTFDMGTVTQAIAAGKTATVTADLAVPAGVATQPDWSQFSLRVQDTGKTSLRATRSLLEVVGPYTVRVEGPARVTLDRTISYRVVAENPVTHAPIPNAPVTLVVKNAADVVASLDGTTTARGDAIFTTPIDVVGDMTVEAHGAVSGTTTVVGGKLQVVEAGNKVLLTTDKPLYQPGQVINLRALAIDKSTQKPVQSAPVTFEIQDGKGNKILKRAGTTDAYGLAATTFTLGQVLNMGTFQLKATIGNDHGDKTVTVSRYALPKFNVAVAADKPWYTPGQTVGGTIDARYFFGKAAAGADVTIDASTVDIGQTAFMKIVGKTDAQGRYAFSLVLPAALVGLPVQSGSALVNLHVTVVDTAGQKVEKDQAVTVAARALRIALVPESTELVPGLPNRLDLFVTDPLGNPAPGATVTVSDGATLFSGVTDAYGQASFDWTPAMPGAAAPLSVSAAAKDGTTATDTFALGAQAGAAHVLVRSDAAVYGIGDTVTVDIATSPDARTVFVDWLNEGQDVDMRTLDVTNGAAHFTKTVDASLVGSNRVDAYVVDSGGNIVRAGRTLFVRDKGALSVDLATDQPQYLPGAPATLTLSVKDETGAPAVAALGVQIVDEAVFALVDAQPGLLRTYFGLEDDFSQPSYQLRPPIGDLSQLVFADTNHADAAGNAAQVRAAATFAALMGGGVAGLQASSAHALGPDVGQKLAPFYAAEKTRLLPAVQTATEASITVLKLMGCPPTTSFCQTTGRSYLEALQGEVQARLAAFDFWGNAYTFATAGFNDVVQLVTNGPDELPGTDDDATIDFAAADVHVSVDLTRTVAPVPQAGGGPTGVLNGATGTGTGTAGATGNATGTGGATGSANGPRVRQDFPETLYVNPEIITGPDGKAQVTLDMADSITEWRVSTLAHTQAGKLGGGVGGVKVFQEFFVDIDFPATLTRGDTVEFPVAIYNYLSTPQVVHVALDPGAWYTPLGATTADVSLAAGEVTGIRFPVRVDNVGRQTLTVRAQGATRSDAVARSVLVQSDGKDFPVAQSGSLAAGTTKLMVTFPANAVPGSPQMHLDVFPAYLSQVVTGMDSLLRVPTGCFEQTTSTAWPNVLVTDYLKQTNQLKPDIQLKAESLMSAGYQRLLTFEHAGGGFSWFGEQDPMPFLSVTAFGLMEFGDMTKVQTVDAAMMDRTTKWLLGQQAADGSWAGDRSEFFTFQTSGVRNTAFVVWALASSGYQGPELAKGLAYVKANLAADSDAYTLAIAANALLSATPADPAGGQLADQLAAAAKTTGDSSSWDTGGTQTNFYGAGQDGAVATTALVAQALMLAGGHKMLVDEALAFLTSSRDPNGNFGSTQATIWSLRALLQAAKSGTDGAVGQLVVTVDGQPFSTLALTKDQADVMTTIDMGTLATVGTHEIDVTFAGTGKVSYNLVSTHNVPWAMLPAPPAGPIGLSIAYDKTQLLLNDTATATLTVRNNTQSTEDMMLVTVGLPPGFTLATADLDAYMAQKILSRYDVTGKQLILYVSSLGPARTLTLSYHLTASMPVKASDGGVAAMMYYEPHQTASAPAQTLQVLAGP